MKKWATAGLISAFFLAIVMRTLPMWHGELFWGVDGGEYYGILSYLVSNGYIRTSGYTGFGFTYPYFPGFFHVSGAMALFGISDLGSLRWTVPVLGSLFPLVGFLVALEMVGDERVAVMTAFFMAVFPPHVVQTARQMPGALGDLLVLFSTLAFVRWLASDEREYMAVFFASSLALIATHHLSTLFLIFLLGGGLWLAIIYPMLLAAAGRLSIKEAPEEKKKRLEKIATGSLALLAVSVMAALFWLSSPFTCILSEAGMPPYAAAFLPALVPLGAAMFSLAAQKTGGGTGRREGSKREMWTWKKTAATQISVLALSLALVSVMAQMGLLVVDTHTFFLIMIFFLPTIAFLSFLPVGLKLAKLSWAGMVLMGGLGTMTLSFLAASVFDLHFLPSFRHPQYMSLPMAAISCLGIYLYSARFGHRGNRALAALTIALGVAMIATAYPPPQVLASQGTPLQDIPGVLWTREGVPGDVLVAADHRMSSMVFGFAGKDATWEGKTGETGALLHGEEDWETALENIQTPSGKKSPDVLVVDKRTTEGAFLYPWDPVRPIPPEERVFENFPVIYDDGYTRAYIILYDSG